jgi:hypothetical protein
MASRLGAARAPVARVVRSSTWRVCLLYVPGFSLRLPRRSPPAARCCCISLPFFCLSLALPYALARSRVVHYCHLMYFINTLRPHLLPYIAAHVYIRRAPTQHCSLVHNLCMLFSACHLRTQAPPLRLAAIYHLAMPLCARATCINSHQ